MDDDMDHSGHAGSGMDAMMSDKEIAASHQQEITVMNDLLTEL